MSLPLPVVFVLGLIGVGALVSTCSTTSNAPRSTAATAPSEAEQLRQAALAECNRTIASRTTAFHTHVANGRLFYAVEAMGNCASLTGNSALAAEVSAVHVDALTKAATNKRAPAAERLRSFDILERLYPEQAKALPTLKAALEKQASAEKIKSDAAQARADAARKRREGVRIGMSEQDVLDSSWGRPRKVNRTTRASGTAEQWVYDGGYLYFDNGVLTSIQN